MAGILARRAARGREFDINDFNTLEDVRSIIEKASPNANVTLFVNANFPNPAGFNGTYTRL